MTTKMRRHILLVTVVVAPALTACGVTEYQRMVDYADRVNRELSTPKMAAAICAAGAMLKACQK